MPGDRGPFLSEEIPCTFSSEDSIFAPNPGNSTTTQHEILTALI